MYLGIGLPSLRGRFTYDATTGLVRLDYNPVDEKFLKAAEFAYRLIDRKNATSTRQSETNIALGSIPRCKNKITAEVSDTITAPPLGGAVIGKACDLYGRVIGYMLLMVLLFPALPLAKIPLSPLQL
ncbi:hypothetical protein NUACC21_62690 [Scytonema sp. NUACC21]